MADAALEIEPDGRRVLGIWLDGFDVELADRFGLPALASLQARSAVATLDSRGDQLTGLSGEHLATGLDPRDARKATALWFDPHTYRCTQRGASMAPIYGGVPTVVLDPCYFELEAAGEEVRGVVSWGAHDPGAPAACRPHTLRAEVERRVGAYPASKWIYATPWASPSRCEEAGGALVEGVTRRIELARWLLTERLPDWRLALVGVSEGHSATEGLFHGVDPSPRWRGCPSRPAAAKSLEAVYRSIDDLVGQLVDATPDAVHVVFSLHGMGPNTSDVPSMVLVGELLRRWSGDRTPDMAFPVDDHGLAQLEPDANWNAAMHEALGAHRLIDAVARRTRRILPRGGVSHTDPREHSVDWIPLMRHQARWRTMRAFALPSFYEGRLRVNLVGRESEGRVDRAEYHSVLDELEALLTACTDPVTGEPVVDAVRRPFDDPHQVGPTDADLMVGWRPGVSGLCHPTLGTIGPVPPRRTGGHTRPTGRLLVHGPGIEPRALGVRHCADVVPTLLGLSGSVPVRPPSGRAVEVMVSSGG